MSEGERSANISADGAIKSKKSQRNSRHGNRGGRNTRDRYAALDLGTNNCRLLIAAPQGKSFRIVDAFSRIVRLGEGVSQTGELSDAAMDRAIAAISICAEKIKQRGVTHMRCIATQACRSAENGSLFLDRVKEQTGLEFEVIPPEEEARLAVLGCNELLDPDMNAALIFDIGGGSTEISWLRKNSDGKFEVAAWMSMPVGVVSLSEEWNGRQLTDENYERAVAQVRGIIEKFGDPAGLKPDFQRGSAHFLGTSGTVTSIAGVHLQLPRYRRDRVDGLWLDIETVNKITQDLHNMSLEDRAKEPCIGPERADLVVCGCIILDALAREWPVSRVRVADRGLREGLLAEIAARAKNNRKRRRRRKRKKSKASTSSA